MARPRHAQVRAWFHGRCGYCGVAEADTGGELTVDHYLPVAAGGGDADENHELQAIVRAQEIYIERLYELLDEGSK